MLLPFFFFFLIGNLAKVEGIKWCVWNPSLHFFFFILEVNYFILLYCKELLNPLLSFQSALHIHESSRHDDLLHKSDKSKLHALDSHMTCDVLR